MNYVSDQGCSNLPTPPTYLQQRPLQRPQYNTIGECWITAPHLITPSSLRGWPSKTSAMCTAYS